MDRDAETGISGFQECLIKHLAGLGGSCFVAVHGETQQTGMTVRCHIAYQFQGFSPCLGTQE